MKKILLALLLVLASAVPAASQTPPVNGCNKMFTVNQAAVSITRVLTGVASQHFDVCGVVVSAGAAVGSATFTYGTGTNCNTGSVVFYGPIALGVNGSFVDHTAFPQIAIPAVNVSGVPVDICLTTVGAGPTTVIIYYAQF